VFAQDPESAPSSTSDQREATNEYAAFVGDGNRIEISSPTQAEPVDTYLQHLLKQLQQSWGSYIPDEARNGTTSQVTAVFEIRPNGKILKGDPRIVASSGQPKLDMAAVYAIRFWKQYDSLPTGFQSATLKVQVRFWYNVSRTTWIDVPPALLPGGGPANTVQSPQSGSPNGVGILSDTLGVDFRPYVRRMLAALKKNWSAVMPEEAKMGDRGVTYVQYTILPNGALADASPQVQQGSGKAPLDKAALTAVENSAPFEPLPHEFHGPYLRLRVVFIYNIPPSEVNIKPTGKE
jgi:TonB family protein